MPPAINLHDPSVFPSFYSLPEALETSASASPNLDDHVAAANKGWYMVAQVKENMTITKPTLIVTDRTGMDFAVIFEDTSMNLKGMGLKKGMTIVVPRGLRTVTGEGRKAIMRVERGAGGGVKAIPGSLELVMAVGEGMADESFGTKCWGCKEEKEALKKCTGCDTVVYCSKECQVRSWEAGHKKGCRVVKAVKEVWPAICA
ncbi:uncharacterized protein BCR38DRAFT_406807 [Pseudomassariella vexata]|uniref:MYND-type domain-containing protein n=1 Tax=Pseudomassariella vexata TaxID=1141098 RepID=A0A1Y2EBH5_9PEZI|nr:uncharacterized protein BCR38DRAFT_406807 [Pseudomassariella vexata]ORY68929.1 hypothetical protein BCR38DRAFT_406807 [Pseudomassariella vexata]